MKNSNFILLSNVWLGAHYCTSSNLCINMYTKKMQINFCLKLWFWSRSMQTASSKSHHFDYDCGFHNRKKTWQISCHCRVHDICLTLCKTVEMGYAFLLEPWLHDFPSEWQLLFYKILLRFVALTCGISLDICDMLCSNSQIILFIRYWVLFINNHFQYKKLLNI